MIEPDDSLAVTVLSLAAVVGHVARVARGAIIRIQD